MEREHTPHLIYFADPMCSWCWGFSPVIADIGQTFELPIRVVLGGLRPGTTTPMTDSDKASMRGHWEHVHAMTGQPFDWHFFERSDFVYDTEPACRAVVIVRRQGQAFAALHRMQQAFYAQNVDVTDPLQLATIAVEFGFEKDHFLELWQSEEAIEETRQDFSVTLGSGVTGFPTLAAGLGDDEAYSLITRGYQSRDAIFPILERWLAGQTNS